MRRGPKFEITQEMAVANIQTVYQRIGQPGMLTRKLYMAHGSFGIRSIERKWGWKGICAMAGFHAECVAAKSFTGISARTVRKGRLAADSGIVGSADDGTNAIVEGWRNFECYSEDPYQSGKMATAYIEGIQSNGTGACIKHFVCNDQEFERNSNSSEIQERPRREIYLEPFRLAIRDAKPWSVMSAYNRINGVFASENGYTLKTILKEEWGFDGIVMSDWFGTYTDGVPGGGLDLEMPGPARWMSAEKVKPALERGDLTDDALNDKIRRLLLTIERAGAFANPELQKERSEDKPEHRALIREAAREASRTNINP